MTGSPLVFTERTDKQSHTLYVAFTVARDRLINYVDVGIA